MIVAPAISSEVPRPVPVGISRARIALKRTLKLLLGGVAWPFFAVRKKGLRVLFYHRVNPYPFEQLGPVSREITVTPEAFEAQLAWLQRKGYRSAAPQELEAVLAGEQPVEPKTVVITFDDGFEDNYLWAHPLLVKYGFQGVFFITTKYVGAESGPDWTAGDMPGYGRFLNWEQIRQMHREGAVIASHTCSHRLLTELDEADLAQELAGSRAVLEEHLQEEARWCAYPSGDQDERVQAAALAAGYSAAFTCVPGPSGKDTVAMAVPRIEVSASDSPLIFRIKLSGALDWTRFKESVVFRRLMGRINRLLIRKLAEI
jgi:peptidoglycan/xylan/chitin deacetylase (PgdA/CDA1 family)